MKKNILFLFITGLAYSQVGINTASPNAALDVVSTTKGVLIPRMNNTAMLGLTVTSAQDGMVVYNTTYNCFYFYDTINTIWQSTCNTIGSVTRNTTIVTGIHNTSSDTTNPPYTVAPNDDIIFFRYTSSTANLSDPTTGLTSPDFINSSQANIILPDPHTSKGRMLTLIFDDVQAGIHSSASAVNYYTNYPIYGHKLEGAYTYYNNPNSAGGGIFNSNLQYKHTYQLNDSTGSKMEVISDGVRWIVFGPES
ncbi:hypothetical protein DBR39_01355 [Chryseobacterium sp. KBW03]|uniref:hypothetical protein n=1 Tax=Chryseobacterium sp. KBW03 TaxID=2153362 RepID=UPI000F5A85AF|nr:hypothetical protein [Chryseobacterium sp. KBW03]RQO42552.1 hypothetical protein DBR39_01355 [Chryseobacterium sp. KBW03]